MAMADTAPYIAKICSIIVLNSRRRDRWLNRPQPEIVPNRAGSQGGAGGAVPNRDAAAGRRRMRCFKRSDEPGASACERDAPELCGPFLARGNRKGAGERSGGYDFPCRERRALRILRQRLGEMTQGQ